MSSPTQGPTRLALRPRRTRGGGQGQQATAAAQVYDFPGDAPGQARKGNLPQEDGRGQSRWLQGEPSHAAERRRLALAQGGEL